MQLLKLLFGNEGTDSADSDSILYLETEPTSNEHHITYSIEIDDSKVPEFTKPEYIRNPCVPKLYKQYQNGIYKNFGIKNTVRGSRRRDN